VVASGQSCEGRCGDSDDIFFTVDRIFNYEPFYADFGPLNLGDLYRFCQVLNLKLKEAEKKKKKVYFYTNRGVQKRSNAAYLIACYQVIYLDRSPIEAWSTISHLEHGFLPFRDVSQYPICTYKMTIRHCLEAVQTAISKEWFDKESFDYEQYAHYERVENGDLNVIIPGKFVHFSGPNDRRIDADGYPSSTPEDYFEIFEKLGVTDIIRLNKKCYDSRKFTRRGFKHHDLYFIDGTTPSSNLLVKFLNVCENAKGMIAVHCKAGLGRTGTTVGCYMMKHYDIPASSVIAWLRICRPGSVIGPQQQFLETMEQQMRSLGTKHRALLKEEEIALEKKTKSYLKKAGMSNVNLDKSNKIDQKEKAQTDAKLTQGDKLNRRKFNAQHKRQESLGEMQKETNSLGIGNLVTTLSRSILPRRKSKN
jgi:cell division cycle 14